MPSRVVGADHIVISVSDIARSREFYGKVLGFLGFTLLADMGEYVGWTNGQTRLWIAQADPEGRNHKHRKGEVGFHHYAFGLRSRRDVDELYMFLRQEGIPVPDPPAEYYEDFYAVYFLDPDGMRFEGMKYGEKAAKQKKKRKGRA